MATARRTYLQMTAATQLRPKRLADGRVRVERLVECPPSFYRYLYTEVGRRHLWLDRLPWSDGTIRGHLGRDDVSVWLLSWAGAPAGYFELVAGADGSVEIAYFGLLPEFIGRGLGGHLLTAAVERAWELADGRVWLHTSSLDHQAALSNYLARGFTIERVETYEAPQPGPGAGPAAS
jgi:ribosomal protein S18 acetylase RimI-like enzyme